MAMTKASTGSGNVDDGRIALETESYFALRIDRKELPFVAKLVEFCTRALDQAEFSEAPIRAIDLGLSRGLKSDFQSLNCSWV